MIQRGVGRLMLGFGFSVVTELVLRSGRRADVVALGPKGDLWIVEIKSSIEDFRATANGRSIASSATDCSSPPMPECRRRSSRRTPGC
ncbi:hypothetical protein A6302_01782 [Methylobrevis pamukkalensis]|uniref:Uncharacterized protein n=1 Tax=Methylobrevis pamukkalensis TaxID=1439726 RepID=A0A1E3H3Z1_9HYPH|nr:hypothetical protein A6302_01782 [Methylobrevis pamukkalensis]